MNKHFMYYGLDDFGQIIRYFETYEDALRFTKNKKLIRRVDLYNLLGECLF